MLHLFSSFHGVALTEPQLSFFNLVYQFLATRNFYKNREILLICCNSLHCFFIEGGNIVEKG